MNRRFGSSSFSGETVVWKRTMAAAYAKSEVHVNVSALDKFTFDELCQQQNLFQSNHSNDTLVFDPVDVGADDFLDALHLNSFYSSEYLFDVPVWFKATFTTLFILNMIISCTHNLRTLIAITINKSCWSSTNVLISTLAVSDLLTVCCATPTEVSKIINGAHIWVFGDFGCYFLPFVQSAAILSNALILCLIAYDRYVCVVKMENFSQRKPTLLTGCLVAGVWIIAIVVSIPSLYLWRLQTFIMSDVFENQPFGVDFCNVFSTCYSNPEFDTSTDSFYYIYHVCLCGAIFCPLFLLFLGMYARIGHFLWIRRVVGGGSSAHQQMKRKKKIALALLGLVFTFFVCRMPNWIYVILHMSQLIPEMTAAIEMVSSILIFLSVLNTTLNPLLYVLVDEPMSKTLSSCSSCICNLFDGFCMCCQDSTSQVGFQGGQSQLMVSKTTKLSSLETSDQDGTTDGPSPSVLAIINEINKATASSKDSKEPKSNAY